MISSSLYLLPFHCRPDSLQSTATGFYNKKCMQVDAGSTSKHYNCFPHSSLVFSKSHLAMAFLTALSMTFITPGTCSRATGRWQPLNLPAQWPTYMLRKWKSEWLGPSASQSLTMCLHMTLTWCPGMSPGHPRSFPVLEKRSAKRNSFSQIVMPQSPFAPYIPPVHVIES